MSFFNEIASAIGDSVRTAGNYNIINYNGDSIYIEGIKRLVSISEEKVIMTVKKGVLTVTGVDLCVFDLEKESLIIKGNIRATYVE
ncbi:MAG: hypothetical protein LBH24_05635 [Clostridiales bacterium]|jgi:riboflavin synthase alpha subunit|nr:hypothetical protein [Clostridiales bacterium]